MERFRKDERQHPLPHVRTNPTSPSPILDHPNNVPGDLLELFGYSHGPSREPLERSHQRYQGLTVFSSVGERVREDTRLRVGGDQVDRVPDDLADHLAICDIQVIAHRSENPNRRRFVTFED